MSTFQCLLPVHLSPPLTFCVLLTFPPMWSTPPSLTLSLSTLSWLPPSPMWSSPGWGRDNCVSTRNCTKHFTFFVLYNNLAFGAGSGWTDVDPSADSSAAAGLEFLSSSETAHDQPSCGGWVSSATFASSVDWSSSSDSRGGLGQWISGSVNQVDQVDEVDQVDQVNLYSPTMGTEMC